MMMVRRSGFSSRFLFSFCAVALVALVVVASVAALLFRHQLPDIPDLLPTLCTNTSAAKDADSRELFTNRLPVNDADSRCLNPYAQRGFVWHPEVPADSDPANDADTPWAINTTWVPFYSGLLDEPYAEIWNDDESPTDPTAAGHRTFPDDQPPQEMFDTAPYPWVRDFARHHALVRKAGLIDRFGNRTARSFEERVLSAAESDELDELESRLAWIKHTRMLLLSDSVDRFEAHFLCERFDQRMKSSATSHTISICHIPYWNFTISHWAITSTFTTLPPWWWLPTMGMVSIEDRWRKIYMPARSLTIGMNGQTPDLVAFQSGLWDHKAFILGHAANQNLAEPDYGRDMNWRELRFYMQRVRRVVGILRETFGDTVPLLYRVTSPRKDEAENVGMHSLVRAARFVCRETDVETMEFGSLVQGFVEFYRDGLHVANGPLSVMWSNMMFWYLYRVKGGVEVKGQLLQPPTGQSALDVTENWDVCHQVYMRDQK
ncbi:hypothetical protein V1506DRAFT_477955 [Lipomyces tetrasporus]